VTTRVSWSQGETSIGMTTYLWHPQERGWRYTVALGIIVSAMLCWWITRRGGDWALRIVSLMLAIAALGLLTEQETYVDTETRTLRREGRLFGQVPVWRWRRPLSDFSGVSVRRYEDSDGQLAVYVELTRLSGRALAVRYFYGQACSEARSAARELARATGLQMREEVG
jgi:hypothetical protein